MSSSHGNPFTLSPLDSDPGNHTADQDKSLLLGDRLAHEPSSGSADSSADGSSSSHHPRPMALADAKRRLKQIYLSLPTEDLKPFDDFVFETMSVYSTREEGSFFRRIIVERFLLLAGLMAFQSLSSEIISHFQGFIKEHMIVTLFLTMLVGAGGNAGSQSAVNIIRGMATGRVTGFSAVIPELVNGLVLATLLVFCGFARVYFLHAGTLDECLAVVASLFLIVATSVVIGAALPLMLASPTRAYENAWLLLDSQVRMEFDRASQSTRARSLSPHQLSSSSLIHRPRPRRGRRWRRARIYRRHASARRAPVF